MEVHFSEETESRLNAVAATAGHPTPEYVRELVERYLDDDSAFRDGVRNGFAALDRGDYLTEEEMSARVGRMLSR